MLEDGAFGWQMLLGAGSIAGVCAGLLGIGGAVVLVPALIYGLPFLGVDSPELPKIAMATSLGLIIPSTVASTQAHAARGTVDWSMWAIMAPALVAGSLAHCLIVNVTGDLPARTWAAPSNRLDGADGGQDQHVCMA